MSKISIITINYNNLEGLKRTVESVINQTRKEFEYIVIDGGSSDGSKEYIESYSKSIDYWVSESDSGIYNAMNKGIAKATGEYLLFLNSGDHFYENTVLEKNYKFIDEYDLIYFNLQIIENNNIEIKEDPEFLSFSFLLNNCLSHPATFIKKELFSLVGLYDEKYKIVSDWKFFLFALFRFNCSYKKVNSTLSSFYSGGISSTVDNYLERDKVLNEDFKAFISDYEALFFKTELLKSNRFKMLQEIEKTTIGKKMVSLIFRAYIVLFSKKKLKNIIN